LWKRQQLAPAPAGVRQSRFGRAPPNPPPPPRAAPRSSIAASRVRSLAPARRRPSIAEIWATTCS